MRVRRKRRRVSTYVLEVANSDIRGDHLLWQRDGFVVTVPVPVSNVKGPRSHSQSGTYPGASASPQEILKLRDADLAVAFSKRGG